VCAAQQFKQPFNSAHNARSERRATLASGIIVVGSEAVAVPVIEFDRMALANLLRGESLEQAEIDLDEFLKMMRAPSAARSSGLATTGAKRIVSKCDRSHCAAARICARPDSESSRSVRPK
jgi:hypothetical protein